MLKRNKIITYINTTCCGKYATYFVLQKYMYIHHFTNDVRSFKCLSSLEEVPRTVFTRVVWDVKGQRTKHGRGRSGRSSFRGRNIGR